MLQIFVAAILATSVTPCVAVPCPGGINDADFMVGKERMIKAYGLHTDIAAFRDVWAHAAIRATGVGTMPTYLRI